MGEEEKGLFVYIYFTAFPTYPHLLLDTASITLGATIRVERKEERRREREELEERKKSQKALLKSGS